VGKEGGLKTHVEFAENSSDLQQKGTCSARTRKVVVHSCNGVKKERGTRGSKMEGVPIDPPASEFRKHDPGPQVEVTFAYVVIRENFVSAQKEGETYMTLARTLRRADPDLASQEGVAEGYWQCVAFTAAGETLLETRSGERGSGRKGSWRNWVEGGSPATEVGGG